MRSKWRYVVVFTLFFQWIYSQEKKDSLLLRFAIKYGNETLQRDKKYISLSKDTLQLETFRFYISNIHFLLKDQSKISEDNSYHLIDSEDPNTQLISIPNKSNIEIKKIMFSLGIDSLASVSGALAGDLDPTKGMFWAWQSGYINFKMEGKSTSCKTRNNAFQFHIGGYLQPNYAVRTLEFETKNSNLEINVDLAKFFNQVQLSELNSVMIPGSKAMDLADKAQLMFSISEPLSYEK